MRVKGNIRRRRSENEGQGYQEEGMRRKKIKLYEQYVFYLQ